MNESLRNIGHVSLSLTRRIKIRQPGTDADIRSFWTLRTLIRGQRATLQTPQGFDATHGGEPFSTPIRSAMPRSDRAAPPDGPDRGQTKSPQTRQIHKLE